MSQIYFIGVKIYMFRTVFPSIIGVKDCAYCNRLMSDTADCLLAFPLTGSRQYLFNICLLQHVQFLTPVDGRKDRPKHVDCYSNKINLKHWCIWLVLLYRYITMHGPMGVKKKVYFLLRRNEFLNIIHRSSNLPTATYGSLMELCSISTSLLSFLQQVGAFTFSCWNK